MLKRITAQAAMAASKMVAKVVVVVVAFVRRSATLAAPLLGNLETVL